MTGRFGIIGYPVSHSLSPELFSAAYGGRYAYDLIEAASFGEARERFTDRYRAVNVTMPFKEEAAAAADVRSAEVERTGAANILVRTKEGIIARNSDYLAVRSILRELLASPGGPLLSVAVIGTGGAGKAAKAAAEDEGFDVEFLHHGDIASGLDADLIIYTCPRACEGTGKLRCRVLLESNYKDPCLRGVDAVYIPGTEWLVRQAVEGYELMTGEKPDFEALRHFSFGK